MGGVWKDRKLADLGFECGGQENVVTLVFTKTVKTVNRPSKPKTVKTETGGIKSPLDAMARQVQSYIANLQTEMSRLRNRGADVAERTQVFKKWQQMWHPDSHPEQRKVFATRVSQFLQKNKVQFLCQVNIEINKLQAEMSRLMNRGAKERAQVFKKWTFMWHPDKHPEERKVLATRVFQFLQNEKDQFLRK